MMGLDEMWATSPEGICASASSSSSMAALPVQHESNHYQFQVTNQSF